MSLDESVRCPSCGGQVRYQLDCPGYPVGKSDRIMVCSPRCGNAHYWECAGEDSKSSCGWSYREPNSRRDGRGVKPEWLDRELNVLSDDIDHEESQWETVS